MKFDERDRGRLVLVLVVTLLAVPTIWLFNRGDDRAPAEASASATTVAGADDPIGDDPSIYLAPGDDLAGSSPTTPAVVVGTAEDESVASASATYTRDTETAGWDDCAFNGLESGLDVTVVNVANGKSTTCTIVPSGRDDGTLILHAETFADIAPLVEAPIHVQIRR